MEASYHHYNLGDEARHHDIDSNLDERRAKRNASNLLVGDAAFILRSDGTWRYSTVIACNASIIEFAVKDDGATKKVGAGHWGARIRTFRRDTPGNMNSGVNRRDYLKRSASSIIRIMALKNSSENQIKSKAIHRASEATNNGAGDNSEIFKNLSFENRCDIESERPNYCPTSRRKALSETISGVFTKSCSQISLDDESLRVYHDTTPFNGNDCSEQRGGRPRLTKMQSISQTISTIFVPEKGTNKSKSRSIEVECVGRSERAFPGESSAKQGFPLVSSEQGNGEVHDEIKAVLVEQDPNECKPQEGCFLDDVFDKHGIPLNKQNPHITKNSMSVIFKTMMSVESGVSMDDEVNAPGKHVKVKPRRVRNPVSFIFKNIIPVDDEPKSSRTRNAAKTTPSTREGVNDDIRRSSTRGSLRRSTCNSVGNGDFDISATSRNAFVALMAEKSDIDASLRSRESRGEKVSKV